MIDIYLIIFTLFVFTFILFLLPQDELACRLTPIGDIPDWNFSRCNHYDYLGR